MTRWIAVVVTSCIVAVAPVTAQDAPAGAGRIVLEIEAIRSDRGHVRCLLFESADGFPMRPGAAVARTTARITGGRATCAFAAGRAGEYAIAAIHDEDDDGQLDTGMFGIPTEGTATSRDARGTMGPPGFDAARFEHAGDTRLRCSMTYL